MVSVIHMVSPQGVRLAKGLLWSPVVRSILVALTFAALVSSAGAFSSGCGGARAPTVATGQVRFVISPDTARIYTDEHFVGTARVLDVRPAEFRVGPRRFTITADGHFPHDLEVELTPGTTVVEVSLRPVPP